MKTIIANWKMHGTAAQNTMLAAAAIASSAHTQARIVLCPPALFLPSLAVQLSGQTVALGGQDCHTEHAGAYTGNISAAMLHEAGCEYVIVGHSERRQYEQETDALVAQKATRALEAGLTPIICVGETLAQREAGIANTTVTQQLTASIPPQADAKNTLIAYEPVWAIGTGKIPTDDDIAKMHGVIAAHTRQIPTLYGGSVKPNNAASILALPDVSGVLVGGASLDAESFDAIIAAA